MKRLTALVLALLLTFSLGACGKQPETAGGWSEAESGEMTDDLTEIFRSAVEGTEYEAYVPVSLLETQVVAGTNYKFLCTAADGTEMLVTVYCDLSDQCSVLSVEKK